MSKITDIETCLWDMIIVKNALNELFNVGFTNLTPRSPSVVSRYAHIEFVNFIKAYNKLLGVVDLKMKKQLLCFTPLIKPIMDNKDGIKNMRNLWIGHIPNEDTLEDGMTKLIKDKKLSEDVDSLCLNIMGVISFVHIVEKFFSEEHNSIINKYQNSLDSNNPTQFLNTLNIESEFLLMIEASRSKTHSENINLDWNKLDNYFDSMYKDKITLLEHNT